jgi:hypothetical protein
MAVSTLGLHKLKIKDRFHNALPALTREARDILEQNLLTEGWRSHEAIVVWKEKGCIVDGHNRYDLCHQHKIAFRYAEVSFDSEDAAEIWLLDNQLGRRSFINPEQFRYYVGRRYNLEKKTHGGADRDQGRGGKESSRQFDDLIPVGNGKTAEKIGEQHDLAPRTVERHGEYAAALDKIAEAAGAEAKEKILTGGTKLNTKDVERLSELSPDKQRKILAKPAEDIKKALHPEVPTRADLHPHVISDKWESIVSDFIAFNSWIERDYKTFAKVLTSPKWDEDSTFGALETLEDVLSDLHKIADAMRDFIHQRNLEPAEE